MKKGFMISAALVGVCLLVGLATWSKYPNLLHGLRRYVSKEVAVSSAQIASLSRGAIEPMKMQSKLEEIRIWPIGDSITEGLSGFPSYRYWLWGKLRQAEWKVDFVGTQMGTFEGLHREYDFDQAHNAYTGYRIDQVLPMISLAAHTVEFDIALIHIGTNDVWQSRSPKEMAKNLQSLIDILRKRNPRATILLAGIIPLSGFEQETSEWNNTQSGIAERITSTQSPVVFVNQSQDFNLDAYTYDGVHPNSDGEKRIAQNWFSALEVLKNKGMLFSE